MTHAPDWDAFVRRHWERAPARLSLGLPVLPPRRAFQNVIEASAPFRFGTRFRALPDVRFFVGDGRLRAPGNLLPGARDRDVEGYVRRVTARLEQPFQVLVEHPFLLDFSLWDGVRGFLEGLLERVGVPVLPIVSEVLLGDFPRAPPGPRRPHHSLLTLVLHGRMRVHLGGRRRTLEAEAGDVLYVPSHLASREECRGPCLAARLWIPVRGISPTEAVKDVLVTLLDRRLPAEHAVPYLDYPWRPSRGGAVASVATLVRAAGAFEELARGSDLEGALRIIWARRVSARGLEPAPAPLEAPPLRDSTRVRAAPLHRVVRMLHGPGQWIWAINGHAFPMEDSPEAGRVLDALASGDAPRVDELCRVARRAPQRARLRKLLETLHALRAIEVVSGEGG